MHPNAQERQEIDRWLAGLFLAELDEDTLRMYRSAEGTAALDRLERFAPLADLVGALREIASDPAEVGEIRLDLATAYGRLFLVGGPRSVPLHASAYLSDKGRLMQAPAREAEEMLSALDLSLPPGFHEPADHVGVHFSILAELATADRPDLPGETAYIKTRMLTWLPTLAALCRKLSSVPLYRELGPASLAWLRLLESQPEPEKQRA